MNSEGVDDFIDYKHTRYMSLVSDLCDFHGWYGTLYMTLLLIQITVLLQWELYFYHCRILIEWLSYTQDLFYFGNTMDQARTILYELQWYWSIIENPEIHSQSGTLWVSICNSCLSLSFKALLEENLPSLPRAWSQTGLVPRTVCVKEQWRQRTSPWRCQRTGGACSVPKIRA